MDSPIPYMIAPVSRGAFRALATTAGSDVCAVTTPTAPRSRRTRTGITQTSAYARTRSIIFRTTDVPMLAIKHPRCDRPGLLTRMHAPAAHTQMPSPPPPGLTSQSSRPGLRSPRRGLPAFQLLSPFQLTRSFP